MGRPAGQLVEGDVPEQAREPRQSGPNQSERESVEVESVQIDLGELESEADEALVEGSLVAEDSQPATNPFLIESSTSLVWPPPSLVEALEDEAETVRQIMPQAWQAKATISDEVPSALVTAGVADGGPALPRKTPVLEMALDDLPSEPGSPPPASVERLVEEALSAAPELPSRPGSVVPIDEVDEAPPPVPAAPTMEQMAQAADAAATAAPASLAPLPGVSVDPPAPPVRRKQNTPAAWPPPLPDEAVDGGPSPRTGLTLVGL